MYTNCPAYFLVVPAAAITMCVCFSCNKKISLSPGNVGYYTYAGDVMTYEDTTGVSYYKNAVGYDYPNSKMRIIRLLLLPSSFKTIKK